MTREFSDAVLAKLDRAMLVVEAAIAWQADTGGCHFCSFVNFRPRPHDSDCPLVTAGFINTAGERL